MMQRSLCLMIFAVVAGGMVSAEGAEPHQEFLKGLRTRGYYDSAMFYLGELEKRNDLPAEVRAVIPFEKAMTLLEGSRSIRDPQQQRKNLAQAEAFLNQFVKANPQHPQAAQANSERAKIFLERARVDAYQANSPSNRDRRAGFQKSSLANVAKARSIFKTALDQFKAAFDKFPIHVPPQEKEQYAARKAAETKYFEALYDLALTNYQESQAYDPKSKQYRDLLNKAALEFEKIHIRYHSMIVGLYSRMWQGKCFQDQDEIGRALGIYNDLLRHPGQKPSLMRLKIQVLQFRLICLNHEKKKDYQLVVDEVTAWVASNRRNRTLVALGIRWERAQALQKLADKRGLPEKERVGHLRKARTDAEEINKYAGKFKDVSTFMIQEINVALNSNQGDPKDFGTAFSIGRRKVQQIADLKEEIASARRSKKTASQINKLGTDFKEHQRETGRMLELALKNVTQRDSEEQINQARYLLSYVRLLQRRNYDAAILGEYVARHFRKQDPQLALDAAYMALAAYQQAYNDSPKSERTVEMNMMDRIGSLIVNTWPETEKANDARMLLGNVYRDRNQPVQAAKFFTQVPSTSARFVDAQLAAGQAFWAAYIDVALLDEADWNDFLQMSGLADDAKPVPNKDDLLNQWHDSAEKFFRAGITQQELLFAGSPPGSGKLDDLIAAKVSLGYILVTKGKYNEVVSLLTGQPADPKGAKNPYPVLAAITVKNEKSRPPSGIKSRRFAGSVYQLLLRAYVGTQQIDQALTVMEKLEAIAKGEDSENVTAIYVQLGQELQKEIERLKGLKQQQRLAEVRSSFDQFLGKLFERKGQMPYNQLIWIAETYYGLGRGLGQENKSAAESYFKKAADSYQEILNRDRQNDEFVDDSREKGVKLRQVNCKRHQGDYENALKQITELLAENANFLQAQFEAAYVLQDWGASGQGDSYKHLLEAIKGQRDENKGGVWGWGMIANRLRQAISLGQLDAEKKADYEDKYFEARYNVSDSRRLYGMAQSSSEKRTQALKSAKQEIDTLVTLSSNVSQEWKKKFNKLYREIQTGMEIESSAIADITWPVDFVETKPAERGPTKTNGNRDSQNKAVAVTGNTGTATDESSSTGIIVGVVMTIVCLGGFGWFFYNIMKQSKQRRPAYASAGPGNLPEIPAFPSTAGRKTSSVKTAGSGKRRSSGTPAASQKRPEQSGKPAQTRNSQQKRRPQKPPE